MPQFFTKRKKIFLHVAVVCHVAIVAIGNGLLKKFWPTAIGCVLRYINPRKRRLMEKDMFLVEEDGAHQEEDDDGHHEQYDRYLDLSPTDHQITQYFYRC